MPLCFAYGSNMDEVALRSRAPGARAIGLARLPGHRFVLMGNGYASILRATADVVHGVLYDLDLSDIAPLDRYEDVEHGLYRKVMRLVFDVAGEPFEALVYVGTDATTTMSSCVPGYMEAIVGTAQSRGLPPAYVAMLASHLPPGRL